MTTGTVQTRLAHLRLVRVSEPREAPARVATQEAYRMWIVLCCRRPECLWPEELWWAAIHTL